MHGLLVMLTLSLVIGVTVGYVTITSLKEIKDLLIEVLKRLDLIVEPQTLGDVKSRQSPRIDSADLVKFQDAADLANELGLMFEIIPPQTWIPPKEEPNSWFMGHTIGCVILGNNAETCKTRIALSPSTNIKKRINVLENGQYCYEPEFVIITEENMEQLLDKIQALKQQKPN